MTLRTFHSQENVFVHQTDFLLFAKPTQTKMTVLHRTCKAPLNVKTGAIIDVL